MKDKILAITGAFLPYNDTVTLLAFKHLKRTGKTVDVVALKGKEDQKIKIDFENDDSFNKFKIEYSKDYDQTICGMGNKNVVRGMYNIYCYVKQCLNKYKEERHKYIYSSSVPCFTHLAAYNIKRRYKDVKWIASFSDPIYKSPYKYDKETFKEYSIIEKIGFYVYITIYMNNLYEKLTMKHADKLIFICKEQRDFMINNYPVNLRDKLLSKSEIIPLNYLKDWKLYKELMDNNVEKNNTKKTVVHMGRIYGLRDFTNIIEALNILNTEIDNLEDLLVIEQYGEFLQRYTKLIDKYNLGKIIISKDKVSYGEGVNIMKNADALLLVDTIFEDESKIQPYLPSKILEYFLLKKPIIAVANKLSPTYRLMSENNLSCCINDILEIKNKFLNILNEKEYPNARTYENAETKSIIE